MRLVEVLVGASPRLALGHQLRVVADRAVDRISKCIAADLRQRRRRNGAHQDDGGQHSHGEILNNRRPPGHKHRAMNANNVPATVAGSVATCEYKG